MNLGNDADIWPLCLDVINRAFWNNYRTCAWRFLLAGGHGQLSTGGPSSWHGTAFTGVRSDGSGAKGQEGGTRTTLWWGTAQSLVGLSANLVRQGVEGLPLKLFWSFRGPPGAWKMTGSKQLLQQRLSFLLLSTLFLLLSDNPLSSLKT